MEAGTCNQPTKTIHSSKSSKSSTQALKQSPRSWRRLQVRPSPRACDRAPRAAAARPCCWTSWTSWMSRAAGAVAAPARERGARRWEGGA
eukprot:5795988-Prymnesium_polylepis.1